MEIDKTIFDKVNGNIQVPYPNGIKVGDITNNTTIDNDGTIHLNGNATTWDDIDFPIIVKTTGSNTPTITNFIGSMSAPRWAVGDYNDTWGKEIPHNAKIGANTYQWHTHIATGLGSDTTDRYVAFELEWAYANVLGVWTNFTIQTGDILIPANTPARTHLLFNIGSPFNIPSQTLATRIICGLRRIASIGAAPTNNIFCQMVQIHYEIDSLGSSLITTK